jgi:MoaA/NifB/PqqE/SkfB family radical SAM enzyme
MFRLSGHQRYVLKRLRRIWFVYRDNLLDGNFKKLWHMTTRRLYARFTDNPTGIYLEVNSTCNLKCIFCWSRIHMTRPQTFMKKEDALKILDDASPYVSWMCPYFEGEPLLHPDIIEILDYANKKGLMTEISTNGMLLTEQKSRDLIKIGLDSVVLSFDGATKENYEKNRAGSNFETVIKNVKALSRLKKEMHSRKPHLMIQMIVTKDNQHEIAGFKELCKEMGANEVFLRNLSLANTTEQEEGDAISEMLPDGTYNIKENRLVENPNKKCDKRVPVICSNGEVAVCCYDTDAKYSQGNAIQQHIIKDIWNSNKFKDFRHNQMRDMKLDICKQCRTSYHEIPKMEEE